MRTTFQHGRMIPHILMKNVPSKPLAMLFVHSFPSTSRPSTSSTSTEPCGRCAVPSHHSMPPSSAAVARCARPNATVVPGALKRQPWTERREMRGARRSSESAQKFGVKKPGCHGENNGPIEGSQRYRPIPRSPFGKVSLVEHVATHRHGSR